MEKAITIVGMGGGISYAVALKFGHEGYKILMISRNNEKLKMYQEMLINDGIMADHFVADAGDEKSIKHAFSEIKERIGYPEVLFYNAASVRKKNILEEPSTSLVKDYKVNALGILTAVKEILPTMKAHNKGTILITGGGLSLAPHPEYGSLSVGKAAARSIALQLAVELKQSGIKVGTVTVKGFVKPEDLKYNPTSIAEEFWKIHTQSGNNISEIQY